jgi:hypothetical protein
VNFEAIAALAHHRPRLLHVEGKTVDVGGDELPGRDVATPQHAQDFAEGIRDLVDVHHPLAERIRVVLDNLSTHAPGSPYTTFAPEEARRILRRIEDRELLESEIAPRWARPIRSSRRPHRS